MTLGQFDLLSYAPLHIDKDPRLTIYIEGDGFAWVSGSTPSSDPTPRQPIALRLALAQPTGNAAYLGRACQYVDAERIGCSQQYWTRMRFSPEVVAASSKAIDILKANFGAAQLTLVGYSGGAAVAALLATSRNDVERLITVAGNLDHRAWTSYHRIDALVGSTNPADNAAMLASLPQTHFVGMRDQVIPPELAYQWPLGFRGRHDSNLRLIQNFSHACCWSENWKQLYQETTNR